jgi:pre-mRNA-splicing factor SPF27
MTKRPKDYLAEIAPAKEIDWSKCPLLEQEFRRVEKGTGEKIAQPDGSRYNLDPPPKSKRDDPAEWEKANDNAKAQLEHQKLRIENLELMQKFAPQAWRAHNAALDAAIARYAPRSVPRPNLPNPKNPYALTLHRPSPSKPTGPRTSSRRRRSPSRSSTPCAASSRRRLERNSRGWRRFGTSSAPRTWRSTRIFNACSSRIASLEAEQGEKTTDGEKATDGEKGRKRKAEAEAPKEDEAPAEKEPKETKTSPSPRGKAGKLEGFGGEGRAAGVAREEVAEEADGQGVQGQQVMRSHSRDRTNEYQ